MRKLSASEMNRADLEAYRTFPKLPLTVVLENIRSMHNVGSVFRTSDAFRIEEIHLCGITATPPQSEIHKAALGATESVSWCYYEKAEKSLRHLKCKGYRIFAVEQTTGSVLLPDLYLGDVYPTALVFGNEVKGISDDILSLCDQSIEIPQSGTKHSLNVSVAAGIILWHYYLNWKMVFDK